MKPFSFSFRDCAILSSYGESSLRPAIDDLVKYKEWGKEITNEVALLISRCKHHKKALEEKREAYKDCTPDEALGWIKGFLTDKKNKLRFIKTSKEIDRSATDKKPLVLLRISKEEAVASILKIYHRVEGIWIDREFTFQRPDFKRAVFNYFEEVFRCL